MENSSNSSIINNSISSNETLIDDDVYSCDQEESSWTPYFDHLDSQNKHINHNIIEQQQHSTSSSSCSTCSNPNTTPKNLISRAKEISGFDDSLEDTATSPNRSPKVTYFNQSGMNHMKPDDHFGYNSLGKGDSFGHRPSKLQTKGENQMKNLEFQDLKKKGLCLVPVSMLVDYLG